LNGPVWNPELERLEAYVNPTDRRQTSIAFSALVEGNRFFDLAEGAYNPDFSSAQRGPAFGVMDRLRAVAEVRFKALRLEYLPTAKVWSYLNDRLQS
jgi:hypothetical protein